MIIMMLLFCFVIIVIIINMSNTFPNGTYGGARNVFKANILERSLFVRVRARRHRMRSVCTYARVYIHRYMVYTCICISLSLSIYLYIILYIYKQIHTYIHTYIHTCMHAYIHTYIHTYIYLRWAGPSNDGACQKRAGLRRVLHGVVGEVYLLARRPAPRHS